MRGSGNRFTSGITNPWGGISLRINVDWDRCTGNGLCESEAEKYFEVQDNGDLEVLRWDVDEGDEQDVRNAVSACPTEALSLEQ